MLLALLEEPHQEEVVLVVAVVEILEAEALLEKQKELGEGSLEKII
jgi:hypothetical protein